MHNKINKKQHSPSTCRNHQKQNKTTKGNKVLLMLGQITWQI